MHTVQGVEPKQERVRVEKCYTNLHSISKLNNKPKPMVESKSPKTTEYFLSGPSYKSDKKRSAKTTQKIHKDFEDIINGIGCIDDTCLLQIKPDSKPYQSPPRCVAYTLKIYSRKN